MKRKRQGEPRVPHSLLAPWVGEERGRMSILVQETGLTWAAVTSIVYYGAVPKYRVARDIARVTGFAVEALHSASERAAERKRREAA